MLPSALGWKSYNVLLSGVDGLGSLIILRTEPMHMTCFGAVHICLQPGHYDIIYPRSEQAVQALMIKLERTRDQIRPLLLSSPPPCIDLFRVESVQVRCGSLVSQVSACVKTAETM